VAAGHWQRLTRSHGGSITGTPVTDLRPRVTLAHRHGDSQAQPEYY